MYSVSALPPFLHRALQKYGPKLAILTPKERFIFLITRDFLDKTQKSLLAKMAAINQVSAKTDKPARRNGQFAVSRWGRAKGIPATRIFLPWTRFSKSEVS